jgi:hypothetical protein
MVNGRFGGIRACVTKQGRAAEEEGCWYTKIRPQTQMWTNVGEERHVRSEERFSLLFRRRFVHGPIHFP